MPIGCLLLFCWLNSTAQGNVRVEISPAKSFFNFEITIPEAGADFSGSFSTESELSYLKIHPPKNSTYQILVRREDSSWDDELDLSVRRTGNGNGPGNQIYGGTNYLEITPFNQTFFQGSRQRNKVPIQYRIDNISVLVPAGDNITTVVFTLTDL